MNKKGFTLIELLVVIAIIGILATISLVSLNNARAQARDAKRVSDVKQLSTILELGATANATAVVPGCTTANALTTACENTADTTDDINQFGRMVDSSKSTTPCTATSDTTCAYSISNEAGTEGATYGSYKINFYLEKGIGELTAGPNAITTGGVFE